MCPRWLWGGTLGLIAFVLAVGLVLIVALMRGWNNSRPAPPPDWQASDLPRRLDAAPDETALSLLGHPSGDFTFEAIARPLAGSDLDPFGYGIVYRAQDTERYYAFVIGGDGYYAVLRVDGHRSIGVSGPMEKAAALVDWQQFPHIRRGQRANRLRVTCAGGTCRFYVNDEFAAMVEDLTWLSGDVGFYVRGGDGGAVQFVSARGWEER